MGCWTHIGSGRRKTFSHISFAKFNLILLLFFFVCLLIPVAVCYTIQIFASLSSPGFFFLFLCISGKKTKSIKTIQGKVFFFISGRRKHWRAVYTESLVGWNGLGSYNDESRLTLRCFDVEFAEFQFGINWDKVIDAFFMHWKLVINEKAE